MYVDNKKSETVNAKKPKFHFTVIGFVWLATCTLTQFFCPMSGWLSDYSADLAISSKFYRYLQWMVLMYNCMNLIIDHSVHIYAVK